MKWNVLLISWVIFQIITRKRMPKKLVLAVSSNPTSNSKFLNDDDQCAATQAHIAYGQFCHKTPFNLGFRQSNGIQYLTNTIRYVIFIFFHSFTFHYFIIVHLYVGIFYVAHIDRFQISRSFTVKCCS